MKITRKDILFLTFIFCFVVTFAVTIMGITDVIKIRDGYLNTLFAGMVMELVGAVIALFRGTSFSDDSASNRPHEDATGLQLFPNRAALSNARNLDDELRKARDVKMLLVGGSKIIEDRPHLTNVRKALLPNPESLSL